MWLVKDVGWVHNAARRAPGGNKDGAESAHGSLCVAIQPPGAGLRRGIAGDEYEFAACSDMST